MLDSLLDYRVYTFLTAQKRAIIQKGRLKL